MKICMVGIGYVGLVTGTCFAEMGHQVWCVDVDENKINHLKVGMLPIYEPGLQRMVEKGISDGHLHFTKELQEGINKALFCFITVGTPPRGDGSADLSYVMAVAREIGKHMENNLVVVTKSTVPVGTVEQVRDIIQDELEKRGKGDVAFAVASNPEFLKEGTAVEDFMYPDRIIIGTDNEETAQLLRALYQPLVRSEHSIVNMDIQSAEITKYAANAMLATRISFMNEIAQLCDQVGGDIDYIRIGIGTDERIGKEFLSAGVGYGGSCFPKDVKEFIHTGQKNGLAMTIAAAVHKVNEGQRQYFINMIKKRFGENLFGKKIGIWGLAFKAETDDMRESPAIVIIQALLTMGAELIAYDPQAIDQAKQTFSDVSSSIQYVDNMMEAINDVDALVLITDWQQFKKPDFVEMHKRMGQPIIFDGRNQYNLGHMKSLGFEYYCIGRNSYVR